MSQYLPAGITQAMIDTHFEGVNPIMTTDYGEKVQLCSMCLTYINDEDQKLPLDEGVCCDCMWGKDDD